MTRTIRRSARPARAAALAGLGGLLAVAAFGDVRAAGQLAKDATKKADAQDKKATEPQAKPAALPAAAAAVKAPPPAAAVADNVVQQFEANYGAYFRQMYRSELRFVRLTAGPTKPQYEKLAADGDAAVKAAIRKYAEASQRPNGYQEFDPRHHLTEAVDRAVKDHLSPAQTARYRKEVALRTEARKRMTVVNLVAICDAAVVLTADQRQKLGDVLAANWNSEWDQTQILLYGGQFFPPMPDAKILPLLTEPQKTAWNGIPKNNVRFGFGGGFFDEADDDLWPDDPPAKDPVPPKDAAPAKKEGGKS